MTIAFICVLIAGLLPIVWTGVAKVSAQFDLRLNNSNPREFMATKTGVPQRAYWAQANEWESFAPFAAGVIIAHFVGANQANVDIAALVFIGTRILYGIFYISNFATLRSTAWTIGIICYLTIYYFSWNV